MEGCGELVTYFGDAIKTAVVSLKDGTYDINNFMPMINTVKARCLECNGRLKTVSLLLCCTERLCAVYTACFTVKEEPDDTCDHLKEYCRECVCAAAEVLECCHGLLCEDERDFDADIVLAELERLMHMERSVRLRVISQHKRIFSALAELHRTDEACEMLMRCRRLMEGCVRLSGCICRGCKEILLQ